MNNLILTSILFTGLSGLVAQVLVMRELLISFYGNELILSMVISSWIICEAIGVLIIGRLIERIKAKIELFVVLEIIFLIFLPFSIYFARVFKVFLGVPQGEAVGLSVIFTISVLVNSVIGFAHGGLFSSACKIYSSSSRGTASGLGKIYTFETIGTVSGGVIFTYFFIPYLNSFRIAFVVCLINVIICIFLTRLIFVKKIRYFFMFFLLSLIFLLLNINPDSLHRQSVIRQWSPALVFDYRNSVYGNIVVTEKDKQYTFFRNGIPAITTPYPDLTFVEEFGNLPLLFHPQPKDVLVMGSGCGGLINEILKHPIMRVDYVEIDPLIIEMLKKYPSDLVKDEFADRRLKVKNLDGRFYLKTTPDTYDIILIGMLSPSDLTSNRFFTQEFFSLARKRLRPQGIIAFTLPSSLTYLSAELRDLNRSILNALVRVFPYIKVIPGDYNLILASESLQILKVDSRLASSRISERNIKTHILVPAYLDYRLDQARVKWFKDSIQSGTMKINRDLQPFALFQMLVLWNKEFSGWFRHIFHSLGIIDLGQIVILALTSSLLILFFSKNRKLKNAGIVYSLATTGFFGMLSNLILIFSFQVFYGYLYYHIGLLISVFMCGLALGSFLMTRAILLLKNYLRLFIFCEILIIAFCLICAFSLNGQEISLIYFSFLVIVSGFLTGCEFPLAGKIFSTGGNRLGEVSGVLYFADLLGGYLAALLGGIFFLPVLGLFNTFMAIIIFKISSLLTLLTKIAN